MEPQPAKPRGAFPLGRMLITANALKALTRDDLMAALRRHAQGDWGRVNAQDWAENDRSLKLGLRLVSSYRSGQGTVFWIITAADRSSTTVLLPGDY